MVRVEAAPSLLSTSTAPDLTAADELYRTFRAAAARGEEACLSLTFREGKAGASLKLGKTAGPPAAAARPRAPAQPARPQRAAGGPAPSCSLPAPPRPSPPAGRRRGPRSRGPGALLRDERRRHLRIASDVFGRGGRCPPPTVCRPAIPASTPAPVPGPEREGRAASLHVLAEGASEQLLLLVPPPDAPPLPTFRAFPPSTVRLRTRQGRGLAPLQLPQLDGPASAVKMLLPSDDSVQTSASLEAGAPGPPLMPGAARLPAVPPAPTAPTKMCLRARHVWDEPTCEWEPTPGCAGCYHCIYCYSFYSRCTLRCALIDQLELC